MIRSGICTNLSNDDQEIVDVNGKNATKKELPQLLLNNKLKEFHDKMLPCIQQLKFWCVAVQYSGLTVLSACNLFHATKTGKLVKVQSDECEDQLEPSHELCVLPSFDSGVEKIMKNETEEMTSAERLVGECLLKKHWKHLYLQEDDANNEDGMDEEDDDALSPARFIKRLKTNSEKTKTRQMESAYINDCSFIYPTTVDVERLFSESSDVMTAD